MKFKEKYSFEKRCMESKRILAKYPDRIPIIVERNPSCKLNEIDRNKFLVPSDLSVGQFAYVVRKRIQLSHEQAMFLFVNNCIPATHELLSNIFINHKEDDGFLYIVYSGENTFGYHS